MVVEIIGILGASLILLGFVQVATNKWNGKSFYYETCNLAGAVLLGIYAYHKTAYTYIVLNLIWGTVALYAIFHIIQRKRIRKAKKIRRSR